MKFTNNCDLINDLLCRPLYLASERAYFFLVYSTTYPMVQKYLTRSGVNDLQYLGSYELKLGAYTFDMEIIGSQSESSVNLFQHIREISQFSHFWENKFNIFREVDRYYELQEFIAINKLTKHVISIEEICGINSLGKTIKLVTFDSTSDEIQWKEILVNYEQYLRTKSLSEPAYDRPYHYYFTNTFPWHTPDMFRMYRLPYRNQRIFLELQTFLTCMRELTYEREPHLDLISLCSLKLAFCDELNLTEASADLEFEIDALIERFLRRMVKNQTYIKNGEFDLNRYAVDTKSSDNSSNPAVNNLIYTFQHIFQCNNLYAKGSFKFSILANLRQILMLTESTDLTILRDRPNITYKVDGHNYSEMNSKLFSGLLECPNVDEIVLDTNYQWTNELDLIDFGDNDNFKQIRIELVGTNNFNFSENFIQFLKTLPTSITSRMVLEIKGGPLNNFNIFKNLKINTLEFRDLKITFTILTELLACDLKDVEIYFPRCTIEDSPDTWSLLINELNCDNLLFLILESKNTWQLLFESVANHLTKFKLNEFKFKCDFEIICNNITIDLDSTGMKFRFDEFNTRLELQNQFGEAIDLYDWKNRVNAFEDDYKNFEFYQ